MDNSLEINGIRFFGDSADYHILSNATRHIIKNKVPGLTCEIGLRKGMGTATILKELIDAGDYRTHIGIDLFGSNNPMGNELFHDGVMGVGGTPNSYRNQLMVDLFSLVSSNKFNFIFMNLDDSEFFNRYSDGVPVYLDTKQIINNYALVHIDAGHYVEAITKQVRFFGPRMKSGAIIIFDDLLDYNHNKIESEEILPAGFQLFEKTKKKASYVKL